MEGTHFVFWNWTVAVYLFVAGVSAGAFAISVLAYFIGEEKYEDIARIGAYIAPFPLIFGLLFLIYDLERPYLFWKLLVTVQINSVMSLGAWLLLVFSILSFLNFYLWLPDRFDLVELIREKLKKREKPAILCRIRDSRFLESLTRPNLRRFRPLVGLIGMPVALFVGIYTGVLLGVLSPRPFWNNPMLPMLFLVSALKTGTASVCFIGCFVLGMKGMSHEKVETNKFVIHSVDFFLMILSMITIILFIFGLYTVSRNSAEAAKLIMGGEYTFLFWGIAVVIGILFPFCLEVYELLPHFVDHAALREHNPWISGIATVAVLAGGFVLRYVIVYAGQATLYITS